MFKKIEIWVLYLILILVFISYIIFGAMIRREIFLREVWKTSSEIPIISPISRMALFLAEIPSNLKNMNTKKILEPNRVIDRFPQKYGFQGEPLKEEFYLLLSRYSGNQKEGIVELIDLRNFDILHTWNPDIDSFFKKFQNIKRGKWENLLRDFNNFRFRPQHPIIGDSGSLIFKDNSPLLKIDINSELLWMKDDEVYHHSIEQDHEENIWVCVYYHPYKIDKKYINEKTDAIIDESIFGVYLDDGIRKISKDGEVLFEKSVSEIFIENGMEYLLFSMEHAPYDPTHLNDIQPVKYDSKYWKKGDVFLSLRNQCMILLYRPSSNKIIWKSTRNIFSQHDVDIIDNHRISIYNNNVKHLNNGRTLDGNNEIVIYDFATDNYLSYKKDTFEKEEIRTRNEGCHEILPNGDFFVEETDAGRFMYLNSDGIVRWTYINRAKNNNVYRLGWSRILYLEEDIKKVRNLLLSKSNYDYD